MKRAVSLTLSVAVLSGSLAIALGACNDTTSTAASSLILNRPNDIAFGCYGPLRITNGSAADPSQPIEDMAQPLAACDLRSGSGTPAPVPPGQEDLTGSGGASTGDSFYYAFILQSAPGVVTLANWATKPVTSFTGADVTIVDSDPLTPGTNGISVGEDPVAIATDAIGCKAVVANHGSCDLSVLDIGSAIASGNTALVSRLAIVNAGGTPIRAKPAAMAMQAPGGTIGVECPMTATGIAYIAYPSCHAVAAVDVSTGSVVASITFDASGVATIGDGNLTCPDECDGNDVLTPGTEPVTLDLLYDSRTTVSASVDRRTLAIGASNSATIQIVALGTDFLPQSVQPIALQDPTGTLGISQVKMSPQIGIGGDVGIINDLSPNQETFVYAVASDRSVRVADMLNLYKECDTQADPRFLHDDTNVHQLTCMPVGDPATPPRRAGAYGPGIQLPLNDVPLSIDTFRVEPDSSQISGIVPGTPDRMIGYFGVITASSGLSYVLNIDNDDWADFVKPAQPIGTAIPFDIANQLRDNLPLRNDVAVTVDSNNNSQPICNTLGADPDSSNGNSEGPRSPEPPTITAPVDIISAVKTVELPSIRQVLCQGTDETIPVSELTFAAPVNVRDQEFPDIMGLLSNEDITLTYQGSLSVDTSTTAANGPQIRDAQMVVDGNGMRMVDQSQPFCNAGVQTDDIVEIEGCDPSLGNADCPIGYTCYVHPQSQVVGVGACLQTNEADRLADACKEFLTSSRFYTIGHATSGALTLLPRKHVLRTTPLDGCTSNAQCQMLADYALTNASTENPDEDTTKPDTHTWACAADPDRAPLTAPGNTGMRCIETCATDNDCIAGNVCDGGFCMEGVEPPQACVNGPQRYELHASEAFVVTGDHTGYRHPIVADAGGNCIVNPNASRYLLSRIPLVAPACDPSSDPFTGKRSDGTFDPNPCQETVAQYESDPQYTANTCTAPTTAQITRQATAILYRGPGLQLRVVDPTYPGDASCIGDRGGSFVNVPIVSEGYQIAWRQTAGFTPLELSIQPSLPVKVVRGPLQSIWVIDEGDYLSQTIDTASDQGRVYRVESTAITIINVLE